METRTETEKSYIVRLKEFAIFSTRHSWRQRRPSPQAVLSTACFDLAYSYCLCYKSIMWWTDRWTDGRTDTHTHKYLNRYPYIFVCFWDCKLMIKLVNFYFIFKCWQPFWKHSWFQRMWEPTVSNFAEVLVSHSFRLFPYSTSIILSSFQNQSLL